MNIFVLNTGRCGSTTFIEACKHITNYSCGHESTDGLLAKEHLDYPENHIEAGNRLSWLLGRLDDKYGSNAFYVHLKRDNNATAHSFVRRYSSGIIKAYRTGILSLREERDPLSVSLDYLDTVDANIELFLKDKPNRLRVTLENIDRDFGIFWKMINAEGDRRSALAEFEIKYNCSAQPEEVSRRHFLRRIRGKVRRVIIKLPNYIMNA